MRMNYLLYEQSMLSISMLNNHLVDYPTPSNLSYFWGFGSLAGFCLMMQMVSGTLLAMHYTPHISMAFNSVEHMMRDVNFGWLISYSHANGASVFFIMVYFHICRGLYFKSYQYELLWLSGIMLYMLMMAVAFLGYVLVWGQMSFWGATVITNLFGAMPIVGQNVAQWLWGGFSMQNATLNRFFSLHFLIPFMMAGLSLAHIALLHEKGSTNPLGLNSNLDKMGFYPYLYIKDLFWFFSFFCVLFSFFLFFEPNIMGHPDNYMMANALVTPTSMVPEWYFLYLYAMLRSMPSKEGGVTCMALAIMILFMLPTQSHFKSKSPKFNSKFSIVFWFFVANTILLGWLGSQLVEQPFIMAGQLCTIFYFSYFLVALPRLLQRDIK